ncbi:MAG: apolipoprotein N-acyltransferase, partial [Mariprofundaceae bacterium]
MNPAARTALALSAGALMPFAFSPYDHGWLAVPLLALWLALIRGGSPLRTGLAFGFGWFGIGAWWLAPTFHTYGHLPWWLAGIFVALVGLALAWLPALWGWLALRAGGTGRGLLLAFPAAAVCEEWLRGHAFTGLPWTALGNVLLDVPGVGWGAWFGVYGLAALPALAAAGLALAFAREGRIAGLVAIALATGLAAFAPPPPTPGSDARTASIVQPNIPQDVKWDTAFLNETMRRLDRLSGGAHGGVVVWPEAAVPFFIEEARGWHAWLEDRVRRWNRPLLFGGLRRFPDGTAQNGLFAWRPDGRAAFAGKRHLVPFGEYVPAWLPFLHTLVPEIADFRPARDASPMVADDVRFGALVCYESIFP